MRRKNLAHDIRVLAIGTSIMFSQMLPVCQPAVAYAENETEQRSEKPGRQELYALWDDVLDAMDAEALARAELNNVQSKATETAEKMEEIQSSLAAGTEERDRLEDNIAELIDFASNPDPGNRAYADAIMDVVNSITSLTDAQDALGAAKAEYATARQRLADLNAELDESEDGEALERAQSELDVASADLAVQTGIQEEAQRQLDEANESLKEALKTIDESSREAYGKAQETVAASEARLGEATDLRTNLETQVAEDEQKLAEQGDATVPYRVSDLGTPGEYMDGMDISHYEDGIDLSQVPCDFVIVKAMEGPNPNGDWYRDSYEEKVDQALSLGKGVGLYHFYTTNATPEEQARRFVEQSQAYVGKVAFFLDWESRTYSGYMGNGTSPVATLDPSVAKAWLDTVYDLTGVKPGIYMSRSVTSMHDWSEVAAEYPLWVAAYPSTATAVGYMSEYREPYGGNVGAWESPLIWQYSSTTCLDNWQRWLDVNVMYGNMDDWNMLVGQNWQTKLEQDRDSLAKAQESEQKAQSDYDDAVAAEKALAEGVRKQSSETDEAFSLVSERTDSLEAATASVEASKTLVGECETTLGALREKNEDLLGNISQAKTDLSSASERISQCEEDVADAQVKVTACEHKKDMFRRIFEIVNASEENGSGSDAGTTQASFVVSGSSGNLGDAMIEALSPTVAMAATTKANILPADFPTAEEIVANPGILDAFIEKTENGDIRELFSDIKADATRIKEIDSEATEKQATYDNLESDLDELNGLVPQLEEAVAEAQAEVESARMAYGKVSPDGMIEEPDGYEDHRRVPDTGTQNSNDFGFVLLWLGMFVLIGFLTVVFVKFEERR